MLSKLILLAGLVCLTAAALEPILSQQKQLRGFQKGKDAVQVQSSLSSTDCVLNSKKMNPLNPQTYFQCTRNGLALMKCPETMVFETASSACIKDNTPPAGLKYPTCPAIDGPYSSFFPVTPGCTAFYQCSNGIAYYKQCPAGLYWDQSLLTCGWTLYPNCVGTGEWKGATKSNGLENTEADEEAKNKRNWGDK